MKISKFLLISSTLMGFSMMATSANAKNTVNDSISFHTKNHIINCTMDPNYHYVGCAIKSNLLTHHYKAPKDCELDWGPNFFLGTKGKAELECASDTYYDEDEHLLLTKGKVVKMQGIVCKGVDNDGVQCTNSVGNSFLLQRGRQVLLNKKR